MRSRLQSQYPVPLVFDVQTVVFNKTNGFEADLCWEFSTRPALPSMRYDGTPILHLDLAGFLAYDMVKGSPSETRLLMPLMSPVTCMVAIPGIPNTTFSMS
jgi:hypothetical protein